MQKKIWSTIEKVKKEAPLVHNITNYVAMHYTANVLLAAGASPVMAHAQEEVNDMAAIAQSIVLNIGTLSPAWVKAMIMAMKTAQKKKKPVILDPVGAGATPYRNHTLQQFLTVGTPTVIRGNASEILSLSTTAHQTKGVDSTMTTDECLINIAKELAKKYQNVICISGPVDYIIDQHQIITLHNGHPNMAKITAMGCAASALIGAFLCVETDVFLATTSAMSLIGVAGEMAAKIAKGPGSLSIHLLDVLHQMSQKPFETILKIQSKI